MAFGSARAPIVVADSRSSLPASLVLDRGGVRMAELEERVQQLESELRELQATLKTDREQIDHLTNRVDRFAPEIHGPPAEDIQRAFGGRVFGVIGHRGEYGGWGGTPGYLQSLSLRFTVQGKDVEVETDTHERESLEGSALVPLAVRALTPLGPDGNITMPPLPLTLTFEERTARLRVCGREHDFKSYVCGDHAIAFARVGDLSVTLQLPTAFLDSQAIELHDEAEFRWRDEPVGAQ
jgi:uncharacterized coiled-coil protein SlyX